MSHWIQSGLHSPLVALALTGPASPRFHCSPCPDRTQSLTYRHQFHDQLGVGDVGTANLSPAGPKALGWHHAAHVICVRGMPRMFQLARPALPTALSSWGGQDPGLALLCHHL